MTTGVAELAAAYWEGALHASPRWASLLGDRRFDDRLEDPSMEAKATEVKRLEGLLAATEKTVATDAAEKLTLAALKLQLESDRDLLACDMEEWTLDPHEGPQVAFADAKGIARYLEVHTENLRRGAARGRFASRAAALRVLEQLREATTEPLLAYRRFIEEELLPRARGDDKVGLVHVPGGADAYKKLVRVHTSLETSPDEIHAIGLREVARARDVVVLLGLHVLGVRTLPDLRARIARDPSVYYETSDEVLLHAEETLRRALKIVPALFSRVPRVPCVVERVEAHEESSAQLGYYLEPAADGSRPGTYRVNTSHPEKRRRFEAEVLTFHEAVPGHHIQLALAQELDGLPAFRRHGSQTAYVEGWALYAEQLADELGLYSSHFDRLGMAAFDAWRSARLAVDTGVHALGWSRDQACAFFRESTLLDEQAIGEEVDRIIVWPAQALAYKLGQLEIVKLRDEVELAKGGEFDLRAFHDAVLGAGPLGLALLRERVLR